MKFMMIAAAALCVAFAGCEQQNKPEAPKAPAVKQEAAKTVDAAKAAAAKTAEAAKAGAAKTVEAAKKTVEAAKPAEAKK